MTRPTGTFHTRVEWVDTDASGIYHNSTVIRFTEGAEARLMADHGVRDYLPVSPRVRYEVDFEAPLLHGQDVTATVTLTRLGKTSMAFDFEVWGEEFDGMPRRRAARGAYVIVHVEGPRGPGAHSSPWPAEWVTALS